ncbi:MAG: GNAT family N-acetyltransferase [Spirochaetes bacterium]|nr:GNAT family N-acetyltransferase [Spirochaetota bacterium]
MEISLKQACKNDLLTAYNLLHELAEYESLLNEFSLTEDQLKKILFSTKPDAYAVLSYANNEPCGILLYYYTVSTFSGLMNLYVEDFFIKPEFRRKGIGRKMFDLIIKTASDKNCGKIEWKVLSDNYPAIKFYENIGGKENKMWKTYDLKNLKWI